MEPQPVLCCVSMRWLGVALLLVSFSALSVEIAVVHEGRIGTELQITCPVAECPPGEKEAYDWTHLTTLESEVSSWVPTNDRTLILVALKAKDGGYYKCYSYCKNLTAWIEIRVLPMVEVVPAEGLGLHTGEAAALLCRGSGFPRPHVVWSASGDVRIHMELYQQEDVLDDYTVSNQLRIENVHSDMSGTYSCAACVHSERSGTCEPTEGIPHKYVPVVVYELVQLIVSENVQVNLGEVATLECKIIGDPRVKLTVRWFHDESPVDLADSSYQLSNSPPTYSLTIPKVTGAHLGRYKCVANSVFREEEASGTVQLKLGSATGGLTIAMVTVVIGGILFILVSASTGVLWITRLVKTRRGSQREQTAAEKINFETFATKYGLRLHRPNE